MRPNDEEELFDEDDDEPDNGYKGTGGGRRIDHTRERLWRGGYEPEDDDKDPSWYDNHSGGVDDEDSEEEDSDEYEEDESWCEDYDQEATDLEEVNEVGTVHERCHSIQINSSQFAASLASLLEDLFEELSSIKDEIKKLRNEAKRGNVKALDSSPESGLNKPETQVQAEDNSTPGSFSDDEIPF